MWLPLPGYRHALSRDRCARRSPSPRKDPSWPPRATPRSDHRPIAHRTASRRISFAKIREPLEVPDLLALQTRASTGCSATRSGRPASGRPSRPAARTSRDRPVSRRSSRRSRRSRTSAARCRCRSATTASSRRSTRSRSARSKDFTYAAPLFVTAEFMNNETGEIKSQTVFMGDFPLMTEQGHVHHQRHRACRRLAARPLAGRLLRAHRRQDLRQGHLHRQDHPVAAVPGSSSRSTSATWSASASTASASRTSPCCSRRSAGPTRRSSRSSASTSRSCATLEKDHTSRPGRRAARHLPQAAPGRAADARGRRRRCSRTSTSTRSATTWPRSAATRSTRSSALDDAARPTGC